MDLSLERQKLLAELDILDSGTEQMFDDITDMASKICNMPIAYISLIDTKRQYFKSAVGLNVKETPIEHSFCKIAIEKPDEILGIEDARKDTRFQENPLVVNKPNIVSYYGVPLKSKTGIAFGALCVIDYQVKKLNNDQKDLLIKLTRTVEHLIDLRSKSRLLSTYQTKLEQYSQNMEDFAYLAVHDLKAPVRAIDSFVKLLDKKHKDLWDDKDEKYLSFILQSTTKMYHLINDLLEYSKNTKIQTDFEEFDLKDLVITIFDNLASEKKENKPILICGDLPIIQSSKIAFTVLFTNLISNAIKYQDENQIPRIEIQTLSDETNWVFTIKDNGIGIESEYFDEIFKPLKRLHSNAKYEGTGLGLAICKKIISSLKGEITVESVLDKGTTFTVKIPKHLF